MIKGSIVIESNIVTVCIDSDGQTYGYLLRFAPRISKLSNAEQKVRFATQHIEQILKKHKLEHIVIKKPHPTIPHMDINITFQQGMLFGAITYQLESFPPTTETLHTFGISQMSIEEACKKLHIPPTRDALRRKYGQKKLAITEFIEDKKSLSLDKQITPLKEYFYIVEALALLEAQE